MLAALDDDEVRGGQVVLQELGFAGLKAVDPFLGELLGEFGLLEEFVMDVEDVLFLDLKFL